MKENKSVEIEFLCPAGYDMIWLPLVSEQKDDWCLVLTGEWKIEDGENMYVEATRYWSRGFLDRLFHTTPNQTNWYAEDEIKFTVVNRCAKKA